MKESELLGKLMPGHPDIFPIIENIRDKYQIPEVRPEDGDITQVLLTNNDIDWNAVRADIETRVQAISFFEDETGRYIDHLRKLENISLDFPELDCLSETTKESLTQLITALTQPLAPMLDYVADKTYKPLTDFIFEYLLTGKTRDVPQDWFAKVFTISLLGDRIIMVMAGETADPKYVAEQFKGEFTRTFGKQKRKITATHLSTAEFLTLKLQGNSLKRLVERYEEKHPDQFPKNKSSKAYRAAVNRHKDMMKKRLESLRDVLHKLGREKN